MKMETLTREQELSDFVSIQTTSFIRFLKRYSCLTFP